MQFIAIDVGDTKRVALNAEIDVVVLVTVRIVLVAYRSLVGYQRTWLNTSPTRTPRAVVGLWTVLNGSRLG